jgi:LSM domain.
MLDKPVTVRLVDGKSYYGTLSGFDLPSLVISLTNAKDNSNNSYYKVVLNGNIIAEIIVKSAPIFDPKEFGETVEKAMSLRPGDVKVYEEAGVVTIMDKIKVTEAGVEGSGPLAQRVYDVFNEYIERKRKELQR